MKEISIAEARKTCYKSLMILTKKEIVEMYLDFFEVFPENLRSVATRLKERKL